jgi:hypothetical protein
LFFGRFFGKLVYKIVNFFSGLTATIEHSKNIVFYTKFDFEMFKENFKTGKINYFTIPLVSKYKVAKNNKRENIVYVGRIENIQKRVKYLVKLSKYLDCDVHVYGNGAFKEMISRNPNRIKYCGSRSSEQIFSVYSHYKASINVSSFEGFSYSLVESINANTPIIIIGNYPSAFFLVDSNKNGLLLNKNNSIKQNANCINKFIYQISNKQICDRYSKNLKTFSEKNLKYKNFELS